jgi:hypothetical protein
VHNADHSEGVTDCYISECARWLLSSSARELQLVNMQTRQLTAIHPCANQIITRMCVGEDGTVGYGTTEGLVFVGRVCRPNAPGEAWGED